jgi:hypothetical protein
MQKAAAEKLRNVDSDLTDNIVGEYLAAAPATSGVKRNNLAKGDDPVTLVIEITVSTSSDETIYSNGSK